ncbi:SpoIID/LytB domain-containing protein [Demequina mangrovi]|uniref:SpoIID/LytB domain-containing protein n=1 Tax=Demequina mangrovi TaxID=1043493 RepID=UPI0006946A75|nr:SpoIID/LytB domain-containing protein [Demequina mangrovi]
MAALVFGLGAGTASAAVSKVTLSAESTIIQGTVTRIVVKANARVNSRATIQYTSQGKWVTAKNKIKLTNGNGGTRVAPVYDRSYRVIVDGVMSNTVTIHPVAKDFDVTLSAPSSVVPGDAFDLDVKLSEPINTWAKLYYTRHGEWILSKKRILLTNGVGRTTEKIAYDRSYYVEVGYEESGASEVLALTEPPSSFTITGSGWGHGVGMSQYGAYGMAREGYTATEILQHYYQGTSVSNADASGSIRVQVFGSGSDATSAFNMRTGMSGSGDGRWRVLFYDSAGAAADEYVDTMTGSTDDLIAVRRTSSGIDVTSHGVTKSGALAVMQWEGTSYYQSGSTESAYVDLLTTSGNQATHGDYRHGKLVISVIGGRLNVTNVLRLNTEYLYGIAEMPSSWASAALEAQATTARGYALRNSSYKIGCDCNLYDDARSQNFSGWKKENEGTDAYYGKRWVAAVDATSTADGASGLVVKTSTGAIATTYYFSSSGGQSENSENVWSSALSYLRAVDDRWSVDGSVSNPNASWTDSVSQASARSIFGLPDVMTMTVTSRTAKAGSAGVAAAIKVTATSSTGATASITGADTIRIRMGLKGPWIRSISGS